MSSGYDFQIGTSKETILRLDQLETPLPAPRWSFRFYAERVDLASGRVRGLGRPSVTWGWGFLTAAQKAQLRRFCQLAASSQVYIRTLTPDAPTDAYANFAAIMVWPEQDEPVTSGRRLDFSLEFRHLEQYLP